MNEPFDNKNKYSMDEDNRRWKSLYCASGIMLILTAGIWSVVSWTSRMPYASGYPVDPASYLQLVSQRQFLAALTWSLWIVADFLLIAPTVAVYILLQRYDRTLALLGSLFSMFFNIYDVSVTELNSLTLVSLSQGYASDASETLKASFVAAAAYGYYALPLQTVLSFAIGTFGYMLWCLPMAKSFFGQRVAILGAIGCVAGLVGSAAPLFSASAILGICQFICVPVVALWFVILGVKMERYGHRLPVGVKPSVGIVSEGKGLLHESN